ncbi:MAG TPA: hypothetical protein VFW70_03500 [Methylomirabilota bacterium]|nr:hypothetical protein [Methylomirabilota bacterium]
MRNLLISFVAVAALTGCGAVHRSQSVSASPGSGDARFSADQKACTEQAIGQADKKPAPTWGQTINREAYNDCMGARGWDTDALSRSPRR